MKLTHTHLLLLTLITTTIAAPSADPVVAGINFIGTRGLPALMQRQDCLVCSGGCGCTDASCEVFWCCPMPEYSLCGDCLDGCRT